MKSHPTHQRFLQNTSLAVLVFVSPLLLNVSSSADKPPTTKSRSGANDKSGDIEAALQAARIEFEKDDDGKIIEVIFSSADKCPISVNNLRLVGKITTLTSVGSRLSDDHISTEELAALANIKTIDSLKFDLCQFKGTDLKKLMGLPKLTTIDWTDCQIDDDAMRGIGMLKTLTVLKLRGNQITDTGVRFLSKMKTLEELNLDKTKDDVFIIKAPPITDESLITLKPMKQLRSLSLKRNAITDAGLKHLADYKSLKELDLANTQVTDAAIAKLQMALPECKINTKD